MLRCALLVLVAALLLCLPIDARAANGFVTSSPAARHGDGTTQVDMYDEYAQKFTAPGSGALTITEIGGWCERGAAGTWYAKFTIYTHDAVNDCPESQVSNADTSGISKSDAGLVKVSYTYGTQPTVTGGATYWIAVKLFNGTAPYFDRLATGGTTSQRASANPTWGSASQWETNTDHTYDLGVYAVYTGGSTPAAPTWVPALMQQEVIQ